MSVTAGQLAAAILLPPLGIYLARGADATFWIACALTVLAFLPGMVFAVITVLAPRPA